MPDLRSMISMQKAKRGREMDLRRRPPLGVDSSTVPLPQPRHMGIVAYARTCDQTLANSLHTVRNHIPIAKTAISIPRTSPERYWLTSPNEACCPADISSPSSPLHTREARL